MYKVISIIILSILLFGCVNGYYISPNPNHGIPDQGSLIITKCNHFDIKRLLYENTKSMRQFLYHGSDTKIRRFTLNNIDKDIYTSSHSDMYGPGIYMTQKSNVAGAYGKYIHHITVDSGKFYDETSTLDNEQLFELGNKLIRMSNDWENFATDWAEDPEDGLIQALYAAIDYTDSDAEFIQQIWIEFYKHSQKDFVINCVKSGIDGIIIVDRGITVVYNTKLITITEITE